MLNGRGAGRKCEILEGGGGMGEVGAIYHPRRLCKRWFGTSGIPSPNLVSCSDDSPPTS